MAGVPSDAPASLGAIIAAGPRRRLRRHAIVFHEGDPPHDAFFLHEGLVKLVVTGSDGSRALAAFRGAGDLLGEHAALDGRPRLTTAVVAVDSTLTTIDRDVLLATVRHDPDLAIHLLSSFAAHLRASTRDVLDLGSLDPTALVARRVIELLTDPRFASIRSDREGSVIVDMPVSHGELATWAGVSRRSAATAVGNLRRGGAISTGRMRLAVHDRAALERACHGGPSSPSSPT